MTRRVAIGVLASGGGTNLQALIDHCADETFPARIVVVAGNRPNAGALERARKAGINTEVVLRRDHEDRPAFDREMVARLRAHGVEWVCLAGYMRLVTPEFLQAFSGRVLNIHPSLLPAFPGLDAQGQAHAAGVRASGCTVHFVDEGTDTGPIIAQGVVPALADDTAQDLQQRILAMEHRLYPMVLRMVAEGRVELRGRDVSVSLRDGESLTLGIST